MANTVPSVDNAIKAIEEKSKIKPPESQEDYERFSKEMDAIDIKYGFTNSLTPTK